MKLPAVKLLPRGNTCQWLDRVLARGRPRVSLWNYPVLTGGYLGVVTAAELLFIIFLVALVSWVFGYYTDLGFRKYVKNFLESQHQTLCVCKCFPAAICPNRSALRKSFPVCSGQQLYMYMCIGNVICMC